MDKSILYFCHNELMSFEINVPQYLCCCCCCCGGGGEECVHVVRETDSD